MKKSNSSDLHLLELEYLLGQELDLGHYRWNIESLKLLGCWKLTPLRLFYALDLDEQVMSTLDREPVFTGQFYSDDRGDESWERRDIGKYTIVISHSESHIFLLHRNTEITSRAWWLRTKNKYSRDWNNAEWIEIK